MAGRVPTRESRSEGYGRYSRLYTLPDGTKYPSVTTILGAIAKPALINWAAKTEREMVLRAAADLWDDVPAPPAPKMTRMAYLSTLESRIGQEKANVKLRNKAGDIGSQIHSLAEWTLRQELKQEIGPRPKVDEAAEWGFMAWEDWRKQSNLVPLFVEQTCWSDKHGYAGTFDLYCEMDLPGGGRGRVLADWKSAKGIYPEMLLQTAAYIEALIEMGHAEHPLAGMIVRVPKVSTDPAFETRFISASEHSALFRVFLSVLELWKWLDERKAL